ncbi:branched-chain amino acid ABC transporter ATP-binding protein/permease [Nisaea sp.]|uniref:branched-chain amino acid ABC transporter ATP-binding protein/permease n=1 Tax=Nisaea sp. TaxID=2024842 RepID=UPI002B27A602|nr:branched-chain amino acid ABC transporter ATP-binding protein/permease [Nisaea sp.]
MTSALLKSKHAPLWIGALALLLLPAVMSLLGQTTSTAAFLVTLTIAAMGLNVLVGYTGLVSFGHGAWFGIGAYAAALSQRHWFPDQILIPILFAMLFVAVGAAIVGVLMLRRKGVYFALMTLALAALTYTVSFRWTEVTGGEDGLGHLQRGTLGPLDLDDQFTYYAVVAVIGFLVLYGLHRVARSPFGHVLVAIRENEQRATFQGYPVDRYKLAAFVLSASVTALAGALTGFQHYIVSAESTSIIFSGELLAMVVIGGMRHILGPAIGVAFYVLFREMLSIWTVHWLFWFGIVFISFVIYSPNGLVGIWERMRRHWHKAPSEAAAMSKRKLYDNLVLPAFLRPERADGIVLQVEGVSKHFGGIRAVEHAGLEVSAGEIHALIGPNGAGKTTLFNLVSGMFAPNKGTIRLRGEEIQSLSPDAICRRGLARSFQITNLFQDLSIRENLRLSLQARHESRFNPWQDVDSNPEINAETDELIRYLGLDGIQETKGGDLSYGGQRLVDLGIALASKPGMLLLDEPLAGLAAAERERVSNLIENVSKEVPVLIVEHDIDRVLAFSKHVTVMNQGEVLMSGGPEAVRTDSRVQEVYTGSGTPVVTGRKIDAADEAARVLTIDKVNTFYGKSHILNDVGLDVNEGEIVALLGRNGAGKSTMLKTLAGLVPAASGSVAFGDQELVGMPAYQAARLGIGYVPQGRGLFAGMTVAENLELGRLARAATADRSVVWTEEQIFDFFPVLKERLDTPADYLSGGEQQMLAVARALSGDVRLLLLDEPFEGLAPAIIQDLFAVFDRLRLSLPVVIVEHNLDLVLALADRVFVLDRGAVIHTGPAKALLDDLEYRKEILWL